MPNYVFSARLYKFASPGDPADALPQYVIGKNIGDAAKKIANAATSMTFAGTLLITSDDMHVTFDPPPPPPSTPNGNGA